MEFNELNGTTQNANGGHLVYRLPLDMTGASARMQIRDTAGALLLELGTDSGGLQVDGPGRLLLELTATQTAAINWQTGLYDLELTMADGSVDRWMQGAVSVSKEQTHD